MFREIQFFVLLSAIIKDDARTRTHFASMIRLASLIFFLFFFWGGDFLLIFVLFLKR